MVETLVIAALLGLVPAAVAQKKGQNLLAWWIYGSLLFIVALPHALIMNPAAKGEHKSFRMTRPSSDSPMKSSSTAAPVSAREGRADPVERIAKLKELTDKGLISPAEFEKRRGEVLSEV